MKTKLLSVLAFANMIKNTPCILDIYRRSPLGYVSNRTQLQFVAAFMASPRWQEVLVENMASCSQIGLRSYCESRAADVPAYMKVQAAKCFEVSK